MMASSQSTAAKQRRSLKPPPSESPTKKKSASVSPQENSGSTCTSSGRSWPRWVSSTDDHGAWLAMASYMVRARLTAIPCTLMRGGTSKGPFFLARNLPSSVDVRDRVLLSIMGSPDIRQIDGLGGADSLTSKVAVVSPSTRPDADVDYLFLQVVVDEARVDGSQNCGNMLAGVGPFAIENGLVRASHDHTKVRIHMVNTGRIAIADIHTPGGEVQYIGDTRIDGVPGTASPILLDFPDLAGASCGALLPTDSPREIIEGVEATLIDNGMPVVIVRASDMGRTGAELPAELQADTALK